MIDMSGGSGPPDKWTKMKVSTTSDLNASTSDAVLICLNDQAPISAVFSLTCSDGTFIFVGVYSEQ